MKSGYKQTEVGVIPEEWEVRELRELVTFLDGKRRPVKSSDRAKMQGSIPYYGASGIVDYVNDYIFDDELILLGEDGENILSRNLPLAFRISGKVWVNNHAHVLKPNPDTSIGFLTDYLESLNYETLNSGTAQPKLNKQKCSSILVAVPPLSEQRVVAQALSDVDALLGALDQLIAKKRDLKQAAMQQLLTGQTRLPGFQGEWKVAVLGDLLLMRATYGIVTAGDFRSTGVPMMRGGDIKGGQVGYDLPCVSPEKSGEYSRTILKRDDVVIALVGYPGEAAKVPERLEGANISRAVGLLRLNKFIEPDYLVSYLNSPIGRRMVLAPSAGSAQLVVNLAELNKLKFPLPPLLEQTAIAAVLNEIDAELARLEQRREKTRALKQGMMQELLTGRTRLVSSSQSHA